MSQNFAVLVTWKQRTGGRCFPIGNCSLPRVTWGGDENHQIPEIQVFYPRPPPQFSLLTPRPHQQCFRCQLHTPAVPEWTSSCYSVHAWLWQSLQPRAREPGTHRRISPSRPETELAACVFGMLGAQENPLHVGNSISVTLRTS